MALCALPAVHAAGLREMGGSAALGMAISAAGDRTSLRQAAGLDKAGVASVAVTPDSPYATFGEVKQMSSFVAALKAAMGTEAAQKQAEAMLSQTKYAAYLDLARELSQCYGSLSPAGSALSETWSQGVRSTTQGRVAVTQVDTNVGSLWGLSWREKQAMKAAMGLYDTWVKTGSPSRRTRERKAREQQRRQRHRAVQLAGDGGWSKLPVPLTGTYDALKGYSTEECRAAYQRMSELYNSGDLKGNNGGLGNLPGMGGNGGGMPGTGGQGGMPSSGSLPANPFGSSMSGQDPAGGGLPPNPFNDATSTSGQEPGTGKPPDGATSTVGQEPVPTGTKEPTATVAEAGTNTCRTVENGGVAVQLCQGSTVTGTSATITGSIINVGDGALCGLKLLVDKFELSSSFYPTWLPSYSGQFQAGDTITFGVTVPYTAGAPRPQADIDSSIAVCLPPTLPPTAAPTGVSSAPTRAPSAIPATLAPTQTPKPVFDWAHLGGQDTKCLKGCANIVTDLTACEAFDAMFGFKCDVCEKEILQGVKETCVNTFECGNALCHIVAEQLSSPAGGRVGGRTGSVKAMMSLVLGFVTVMLVLNMG